MPGYMGPNGRRYELPRWWWLSFSAIPITCAAVWGFLKTRRHSKP
jgi:hypothetical protein